MIKDIHSRGKALLKVCRWDPAQYIWKTRSRLAGLVCRANGRGRDWLCLVQSNCFKSQVDPKRAEHTCTELQYLLWYHCSLKKNSWGTHMDMFVFFYFQPTSVVILSLFIICISHPIVTVSIQHLGTLISIIPSICL